MPKASDRTCKICGGRDLRFLFKNRDRMHHLPGEFDFYRCRSCGLVVYEPLLGNTELAGYYPKDYYSYEAAEKGGKGGRRSRGYYLQHPFRAANALFYSKILGQNRDAFFRPGEKVLDVGCGDGSYLLQPNKKDCALYGVDIDADALNRLKASGVSVYCGNLWEAGFSEGFFDHIHLSHVAEHVPEADRLMSEVGHILRADGRARLQIPNTASLTRILFGPFWIHWDAPRHIYGFSKHNFARLCRVSGLEIESSRTLENSFSILGSFFYLFNRMSGKKLKLGRGASFWDNEILKILLFPYCFLVNLFGAGDTVEFVLKRTAK